MGYLLNGEWHVGSPAFASANGEFERKAAAFRKWITPDGARDGFPAEPGRYHLYVSLACPWAHRTLIMRERKGLADMVGLSVVHWYMGDDGWTFADGRGVVPDTVNGARFLRDVYRAADPTYSGRVTVPLLWDKSTGTIVSNESAEIIRMFNSAFDAVSAEEGDHRPSWLADEIDAVNARIYETLNNGVYKAGFATTQAAYEKAVFPLFETLDWIEDRLSQGRYVIDDTLTEADIRLYTTLVRFDPVYYGHFKCNIRRIADYQNIDRYLRELYEEDGFGSTTDFFHIKHHYYQSHRSVNPTGIVPVGPKLGFDEEVVSPAAVAR
jgi:putative glutathione S-transferase